MKDGVFGFFRKNLLAFLWVSVFFALFYYMTSDRSASLLLLIFLFFVGCVLAAALFRALAHCSRLERLNGRMSLLLDEKLTDRRFFFSVWLLIVICWIPAFLALYPGTFGYDVPVQVAQVFHYGDLTLTAHHPVAHTLLVSGFVALGMGVFNSATVGYAMFIVFQALLVSSCAARSFTFLKKRKTPLPVIVLGLCWILFYPALQVLVMNGTKDILFAVFLLHFTMDFWNCIENGAQGKKPFIRLAVSGLLMCLFRNQGVYIVIALVLLSALMRLRKKALYLSLLAVIAAAEIFSAFCTYGLKLEKVDKKEMLSLPMQQAAYVCSLYLSGDMDVNITDEQLQIVEEVITDVDVMVDFSKESADAVKEAFDTQILMQNPSRYLKVWVELGTQNPRLYWWETLEMISPYWDMTRNTHSELSVEWSFSYLNESGIEQHSYLVKYREYFERVMYKETRTDVLSVAGIGIWLMVILTGLAIARRDKKLFLAGMPLVLYVFTMLLGPIALLRYLFPVMLATPFLLGTISA